ncbi:hypothetical protein [Pseudomonas baltica]|uniref:hypothetical protein n=1 Tax=Pseudomonas baltica TaxID=2762576 RepID=UPI00289B88DC|nr:hypothetical protein [Pseudomonas baltica]
MTSDVVDLRSTLALGAHAMQIERLDIIQHDLEDTAAHLAGLSRMLEGHARYLRHSRYIDNLAEIDSIEHRLDELAASILDLRGVASNIAKVA